MSEYKNKKELEKEESAERHERIVASLESIADCMEFLMKVIEKQVVEEKEVGEEKA